MTNDELVILRRVERAIINRPVYVRFAGWLYKASCQVARRFGWF